MDPVEHAARLRQLAVRLADPHAADDLVQSTWVRALEHGAAAVRAPASWLRQIMRNEHRMALRGSLRTRAREQAVVAIDDEAGDVEEAAQAREVARIVGELVDDLDDEVRDVVRQRYFDGLSAAEIARARSIPAGTVRWRLKTGIDRLRAQLDARYGERALWAGLFVPLPTLGEGAASLAPTAMNTAATEGTNMLTKIIIGTALAGGTTAGVVAYTRVEATEPTAEPQVAAAIDTPVAAPNAATPKRAMDREEIAAARERWTKQVADIQSARAQAGAREPAAEPGESRECGDAECLAELAGQVTELVAACSELADGITTDVQLTAKVIGSKEKGAVVESVELQGAAGASPTLGECLTESMYTLELGPFAADFEEEITVLLHDGDDLEKVSLDEVRLGGAGLRQLDEAAAKKMLSDLDIGDVPAGSAVYVVGDAPK
jgi:RNA polymerase sigma-70 factor, ECF subfamily